MRVRVGQSVPSLARFVLLPIVLVPVLSLADTVGTIPSVEVRARALAPGEPIKILLRSRESLTSVEATLLGEQIHFVPTRDVASGRDVWCGWATLDLDVEPGEAAIEVHATTTGGPVSVREPIVVAAKSFPEQRLTVAEKFVRPPREARERIERERKQLAAIYSSRRDVPPPDEPFVRPVPGDPSSVYGSRRVFNGKRASPHPGLDLRASTGDPVRAAGGGRVVLAESLYYSGNTVILDHGGGLFTVYAHLSEIRVGVGDDAAREQVIGLVGATGRVTGPHLHWGAKVGDRPFDPSALLDPVLFR